MVSTFARPEPIWLFSVGMHQAESVCNPSINIAGISKPYYGCLCQRVTYHIVQCASRSSVPCPGVYCCWRTPFWERQINEPHFRQEQFCSMRRNKCAFSAFHLRHFCVGVRLVFMLLLYLVFVLNGKIILYKCLITAFMENIEVPWNLCIIKRYDANIHHHAIKG